MPSQTNLPSSYTTLPVTQLRLSHHPSTSATPTQVIIITLYRPANNNAFTETMAAELIYVYSLLSIDPRVKAIVLRGHGDRIFCAGADLDVGFSGRRGKIQRDSNGENTSSEQSRLERDSEHRDGGGRVALAIHTCPKPTVAALTGSAVGVGMTMTLPCVIRIACLSSSTPNPRPCKYGFVFSRRGLVMEAASSYFLPRLIGLSRATHLITTGAVYPANHKLFDGLFSEVVENGGAEATYKRALELADEIANNTSVVSTALMRAMMWRGPDSAEEAHLLTSRVIHGLFGGKDNEEGVKSFMEKRTPNFKGTMEEDAPEAWPWWGTVDIRNEREKTEAPLSAFGDEKMKAKVKAKAKL